MQSPPSTDLSGAPAPALIEARGLVKEFGGLRAVDDMSITVRNGEMVGLIGPNGAGKTTFFNLLAGSLAPTRGSITLGGSDVTRHGPDRRLGHGVGRTFQIPRPFAEMTVLENLLTGGQNGKVCKGPIMSAEQRLGCRLRCAQCDLRVGVKAS